MTRKSFLWLLALVALALAAMIAACGGGDDDGGSATGVVTTPSGTKATPTPVDGAVPTGEHEAPPPPVPELDEAAQPLGESIFNVSVSPGLSLPIDPLLFPLEGDNQRPPCEQFVFAFGWQVTDPYPADGVSLLFQISRDSGPVTVGAGTSGTAQTGCDTIKVVNNGGKPVFVDVHYIIGGVVQP